MAALKPEDCDLLMSEAIRNKDLEAAVRLYEEDAVFILEGDKTVSGLDAVREALRPFMFVEDFSFTTGPAAYVSAAGDIALLRGTWSAKTKDADGNESIITGKDVEVVRKQADGTWRFVIDHPTGAN